MKVRPPRKAHKIHILGLLDRINVEEKRSKKEKESR